MSEQICNVCHGEGGGRWGRGGDWVVCQACEGRGDWRNPLPSFVPLVAPAAAEPQHQKGETCEGDYCPECDAPETHSCFLHGDHAGETCPKCAPLAEPVPPTLPTPTLDANDDLAWQVYCIRNAAHDYLMNPSAYLRSIAFTTLYAHALVLREDFDLMGNPVLAAPSPAETSQTSLRAAGEGLKDALMGFAYWASHDSDCPADQDFNEKCLCGLKGVKETAKTAVDTWRAGPAETSQASANREKEWERLCAVLGNWVDEYKKDILDWHMAALAGPGDAKETCK